jgi:hypothetical protein
MSSPMRAQDITIMFDYLYWARDQVLEAASELADEEFLSTQTVTSRDDRRP